MGSVGILNRPTSACARTNKIMNSKRIFKTPSDREIPFRGPSEVNAASSARKASQSVGFILIVFKSIFKKRPQDREIPLLCIIIAKTIVLSTDIVSKSSFSET